MTGLGPDSFWPGRNFVGTDGYTGAGVVSIVEGALIVGVAGCMASCILVGWKLTKPIRFETTLDEKSAFDVIVSMTIMFFPVK